MKMIREEVLTVFKKKISKLVEREILNNDNILSVMQLVTASKTSNHLGFFGTTQDTATEIADGQFVGDRVEYQNEMVEVDDYNYSLFDYLLLPL